MRYLCVLVVLMGCSTTPSADRSAEFDRRFGATCTGMGFAKGTEGYANCLLKLHQTASN